MSKKWEKGFCMLVAFREKFNHVDVKPRFIFNNYPLVIGLAFREAGIKKINYHQIELKNSIILILYGIKKKSFGIQVSNLFVTIKLNSRTQMCPKFLSIKILIWEVGLAITVVFIEMVNSKMTK